MHTSKSPKFDFNYLPSVTKFHRFFLENYIFETRKLVGCLVRIETRKHPFQKKKNTP